MGAATPPVRTALSATLLLLAAGVSTAADVLGPQDLFRMVNAAEPRVAPDGTRVVFLRQWADASTDRWCSNLWIAGADGSEPRPLTDRRGPDSRPAVSPEGRHVAYVGFDDRRRSYQVTRLYVLDREGGRPRCLTADFDRSVLAPRWSPDGRGVLFLYHDHGSTRLGFAGLDGSRRELAAFVGDGYSAYGAGSFAVGGDGVFAFTRSRADAPAGVAVGRLDEPASVRTVAAFGEELLGGRTLGSNSRPTRCRLLRHGRSNSRWSARLRLDAPSDRCLGTSGTLVRARPEGVGRCPTGSGHAPGRLSGSSREPAALVLAAGRYGWRTSGSWRRRR